MSGWLPDLTTLRLTTAFLSLFMAVDAVVEQVMGIEPTLSAWEADALPLSYTCTSASSLNRLATQRIVAIFYSMSSPVFFLYFLPPEGGDKPPRFSVRDLGITGILAAGIYFSEPGSI